MTYPQDPESEDISYALYIGGPDQSIFLCISENLNDVPKKARHKVSLKR